MPMYEFQCAHCGLRFDKRRPVTKRNDPLSCEGCGKAAKIIPPPTVAGHFKKNVTGPVPQNTGIHDLDTHIDRVIGQSSKQGWDVAEERKRQKEDVMASHGVTGDYLSKNPDGSYRVLTEVEKAAHDRSQAIHGAAMSWRKKRGPRGRR